MCELRMHLQRINIKKGILTIACKILEDEKAQEERKEVNMMQNKYQTFFLPDLPYDKQNGTRSFKDLGDS